MSENTLALIAFLKIVFVACFSYLYSLGGTKGWGKWIRRYLGAVWMGLVVWTFANWQGTFNYLQLLYPLLLCFSLHLGYGGTDNVWIKVRKRSIYGLALGISALPLVLISGLWVLFAFHCVLCIASSVLLGVFNPVHARSEESLIAVLSTVLVLFLI
jgi:hypothetical protein